MSVAAREEGELTLPPELVLSAGQVVLDRYRVAGVLGEGGFGRVYEAEDRQAGRRVALKVARTMGHEARLEREAKLAVAVTSRYSVRVFGLDYLNGSPMIVMELLEGLTLREYLSLRGRIEPRLARLWARQLGEALADAHSLGLVHRDLKPSNIFLVPGDGRDAEVRLLDFGLARPLAPDSELTLTASQVVVGSAPYIAPELIRSGRASPLSDIWSFGVVLYELLAGRRPFRADTNVGLFAAIAADIPEPLSSVRPEAPPELCRLVMACLSKEPQSRPPDMGAILAALDANEDTPPRNDVTGSTTLLAAGLGAPAVASRSRAWGAAAAVVGLLAMAGGLIWASRAARSGLPSPPADMAAPRAPRSTPSAEETAPLAPATEPSARAQPPDRSTELAIVPQPASTRPPTPASARREPHASAGAAGGVIGRPSAEPLFLLTEPDY